MRIISEGGLKLRHVTNLKKRKSDSIALAFSYATYT